MNLFSTAAFLDTVADVGFPGRPRALETVQVGARRFRLLVVGGQRVVTAWPFLDFVEPLPGDAEEAPARTLGYLPRASVQRLTCEEWRAAAHGPEVQPSPLVDWTAFPTWEDFAARMPGLTDSRRKRRKLEQEVGPVRFTLHDERPEALARCLAWKSAQYLATGGVDLFADARNVALFRGLLARGVGRVSTLAAGDRLVAVHLGALEEGRLYWWVPAYDPAFGRYSPGKLLLEELLQASYRQGHREFDFLIGDEEYKWGYATHVRRVAPLGTPPLSLRARRAARQQLRGALQRWPWVWERVQALRRRLRQRR